MSKDSALSRALARIDELEAKLSNISIAARGVVNAFEPKVQEVAGRRMRNAIGALDSLTAEDAMPVARTEQAQESTSALATFDHHNEPGKAQDEQHTHDWQPFAGTLNGTPMLRCSTCGLARKVSSIVEVQDERFCPSCGCQGGVHHGWCKS